MSREIKFKLHHKKMGMSEPFGLFWEEIDFPSPMDDGMACIITRDYLVGQNITARGILESSEKIRYTGLKDSKGNEIYEGDIIAYSYDHYPTARGRRTGVVEWDDEQAKFKILCYSDNSCFEVIGNVYETPELIK